MFLRVSSFIVHFPKSAEWFETSKRSTTSSVVLVEGSGFSQPLFLSAIKVIKIQLLPLGQSGLVCGGTTPSSGGIKFFTAFQRDWNLTDRVDGSDDDYRVWNGAMEIP